ncbi:hypothetical protein AVEN_192981-1 [Araneus ventricosus]|uniref:F-box domain-containing protein n=1 Tax=Araneus ventricosus TaxID=182803 RepID=A0A4Y2UTF3_ARAVE|nr:hypothetical protein AVEN_192981-1 [Araneus ventricosus]
MRETRSELPSLPLEKIYSFLRRKDQINMSLVCRSWSEGYGSPSVWKTFRFALQESQVLMDSCPVMKFVEKYSSMFRHLKINGLYSENKHLVKNWCRHFVEFLQNLTRNTELISVEFKYFSYCLTHIDTPTYNYICRSIADFLASQHHLKLVEFYLCPFEYQESVNLLRIIIENSRESLEHLKLRDFVSDENKDSNAAKKLPMLADLPSLKTLETDYSFIFENMVAGQSTAIQAVKNFKTLVLSKLILYNYSTYSEIEDFTGLTSTNWRFMKTLYPNLQIELILTVDSAARRAFEFFILPNMPISHLRYSNCDFNVGTEIVVLFDHLLACKTNEHLVYLKIDWEEPTQHLSSTINPFLHACKRLKCFELFMYNTTSGVDVLLESWLENRIESLEKVIIDILYLHNGNDIPDWNNINDYVSLLKLTGLNIKIKYKGKV